MYALHTVWQSTSLHVQHIWWQFSFPHKLPRLHPVAFRQRFPNGCSPGIFVAFLRNSSDTCRRLLWIRSAISLRLFLAYIPASISIRSDNVIRLMFPCFPQDVTETIIPRIAEVNGTL